MPGVTKIILLACGSFNPITNMHLRLFEVARDALHATGRYSVIEGVISPVHDDYGKKGLLPSFHRNTMAKLAIETSDWIRVDTWESETQTKWSPTVSVLRHHQNQIECKRRRLDSNIRSEEEVAQIKLLCGADLLESFTVSDLWKEEDKEEIVSKFGIVCITRSGSDVTKVIYESDLLTTYSSKIELVNEWIYNEISATKIRRALGRGQSVKYLIPDAIIKYIKKHGLYGCNVPVSNK